jgi:hypothetical protein
MDAEQYDTIEGAPKARVGLLRQWFIKHHGIGEPQQYDLYRCEQCRGLVTHRMIRERGGCPCASSKLRPTNPTWGEFISLMVLPWRTK